MPAARDDDAARRSVVPPAAGRSLWRAAVWTGVGAAVVCATLGIVAVAICWLPVSGSTGRTHSAIHAGLLTFLAALHGGATVDGMSGAFLPLGMLLVVALAAWRAGAGLADAAGAIGEDDPARLALAGLAQAGSFAVACLIAVPFATLGTSSVPFLGVGAAALLLFAVFGGAALTCYSPLSDWCLERLPAATPGALRAAASALAVYLAVGALLVAAALVVHHGRVEDLSRQVGGGWGGVPILLLGLLAAPNAAIAGAAYLAGPGFAVGAGSTVSAFSTAHGTLPAFPILGAVPSGDGANPLVWVLMALTPLAAGGAVARVALRERDWMERARVAGLAAGLILVAMFLLGWQGGGGIGDAGLSALGASPWQLGLSVCGAVGLVAAAVLGVAALRQRLRRTGEAQQLVGTARARLVSLAGTASELAGAASERAGAAFERAQRRDDTPVPVETEPDAEPAATGDPDGGDQLAG